MATSTALCPLDERRMPRELYVKLFVVNFAVLAACGHLLTARRERWVKTRLCIAFIAPLASFFILCGPLLFLVLLPFLRKFEASDMIGVILGSLPKISDNNDTLFRRRQPEKEEKKTVFQRAVKTLAPLALIAQCVTSIYLFQRRKARGAEFLYDYRVLHLAMLGLITGILWLVHETIELQCPHPTVPPQTRSFRAAFVLRCGWVERQWGDFKDMLYLNNWNAGMTPLLCGSGHLILDSDGLEASIATYSPPAVTGLLLRWPAFLASGLLGCALLILAIFRINENASVKLKLLLFLPLAAFFGLIIYLILSMYYPIWAWPLFSGIYTYLILLIPNPFSPDIESIATLAMLPQNMPCPKAWKDPVADYVWWLA